MLIGILLLALWAGAAAAAPTQQPTPTIVLQPSAGTVSGCDVLEVAIRVEDVSELYGADVRLTFDAELLAVMDADDSEAGVQIDVGDFLVPPLFVVKNEVDNGVGTIWFAASQSNPTSPVSGSGVLATIWFRAREPGTSDVAFTYHRLGNRDGEEIPSDAVDGSVEATGPGCIGLWPDDATIEGCEEIEVEIRIGNVSDLYGADVRLAFDPSIVEVVDSDAGQTGVQIEIGDLLVPPLFVTRNEADNGAGTIWFAASQQNPTPPVNGAGVLAIIHLRAVGTGTSDLDFTYTKMGDRNGTEIPGTATGGSVTTTGVAAPSNVAITKLDATTARLSWDAVSGISEYHVYRDTYAYFDPGATPHGSTTGLVFDDAGALGSSVQNYFYVVRSACGNGFESPNSNRVGEFDFDLYPGTLSPFLRKYNLIGYPLYMSSLPDADALADYVGPSVYQVIRYDNPTQSVRYWNPGLGLGTNFATSVGEPYYLQLNNTAPSLVTFAGDVPALGSIVFDLTRPSPLESCKYNYLSIPLHRIDITTADELAADIGGVYSVLRYDNDGQAIQYRLPHLNFGPNFSVRVGYPYVVCLQSSAPAAWP